jgi:hypothetical protein
MAKADSQIAACSPSFGCASRVDTSFHVERYRSDVTCGGFYYAHPFSSHIQICMAGSTDHPVPKGRLNLAELSDLSKLGLKDASVQQPPFPCNDPLLFVIPSEASGPAVRHSCAPLLPAHNLHQSSPNPHGNTNLPFVIPGFQEWSAEPQIPRLRSPGFPVEIGGVGELHAPFLTRKAHTQPCPAQRGRKSGSG